MASPEINPPADNAKGPELPPMMPLGQPGAHGANPDADAAWLASQAIATSGAPTHTGPSYTDMTSNPPGAGTHAAHGYEEYKHQGREGG
jgi:hypothetical protein